MRQMVRLTWCVALIGVGAAGGVQAQGGKFGTYAGTVSVQVAEVSKLAYTRYSAILKVKMPLTDKSSSSAMAEVSDVGAPVSQSQADASQPDEGSL